MEKLPTPKHTGTVAGSSTTDLIADLTATVEKQTELLAAMSNSLVRLHCKVIELEAVMAREGVGGSSIILPN